MGKTILLADDSLTIQKVVELTFADTDFVVDSTSSGDELLEKLPGSNPDVIICDTIMPGSDGYLVCQRIKSEPDTLHIPVILLTGTFEPFDRDRALAAGCSEIITKPFEARKLVETVERLVSGEAVAAPPATDLSEGAVAPPDFAAAVPPPPPQRAAAEFGTLLAEPLSEAPLMVDDELEGEGLDFTATGFAEMEEAGETVSTASGQMPEDGLDFDLQPEGEPVIEPEVDDDSAFQQPDVAPEDAEYVVEEPPEPFGEPPSEYGDDPEVFDDTADDETVVEPAHADQPDYAFSPAEEEGEMTPPLADSEPERAEQLEAPAAFEFGATSDDSSGGEVTPPPIAAFVPEATPDAEAASASATELSDADVDRIARRVVELAADRLEQIAWEVIPDMAEIVVRERLRELEGEVERHSVTPAN